jgi:hypothetical protein
MHEVLRHPYFMTVSERRSFGIALGGGMIGAFVCPDPGVKTEQTREQAIADAVETELMIYLHHQ